MEEYYDKIGACIFNSQVARHAHMGGIGTIPSDLKLEGLFF
jgi:hypothetical protein